MLSWYHSMWRFLTLAAPDPGRRRPPVRPMVEGMEERCLLSGGLAPGSAVLKGAPHSPPVRTQTTLELRAGAVLRNDLPDPTKAYRNRRASNDLIQPLVEVREGFIGPAENGLKVKVYENPDGKTVTVRLDPSIGRISVRLFEHKDILSIKENFISRKGKKIRRTVQVKFTWTPRESQSEGVYTDDPTTDAEYDGGIIGGGYGFGYGGG